MSKSQSSNGYHSVVYDRVQRSTLNRSNRDFQGELAPNVSWLFQTFYELCLQLNCELNKFRKIDFTKGSSKNYVTLILVILTPFPYVTKRNVSFLPPPHQYVTNHEVPPSPRGLTHTITLHMHKNILTHMQIYRGELGSKKKSIYGRQFAKP